MSYMIPESLTEPNESGIWGISPESLVLGLLADKDDEKASNKALKRYHDLEVLRTNYDPGWKPFQSGVDQLCSRWFPETVANAAIIVPHDSLSVFVAGAAYFDTPSGLASLLVHGQDIVEASDAEEPVTMSRRDLHGYIDSEIERSIAQSLRIIKPVSEGYRLNRAVFEPLAEGFSKSRPEAAYEIVHRVVEHLGIQDIDSIVESLLEACNAPIPSTPPEDNTGVLSVYIQNQELQDLVETLFSDDLHSVVEELEDETRREQIQLRQSLALSESSDSLTDTGNWPIDEALAGVCALASQRQIPVAAGWLAAQTGQTELGVYDDLRSAGIGVEYDDGLLTFDRAYRTPDEASLATESYSEWVQNRLITLQDRMTALRLVQSTTVGSTENQRQRILSNVLNFMESFTVSPTKFIYTIFDPEFHADTYNIDNYVGNSRELNEEVKAIRQWRQKRPYDAESFAEMIPEILNHPLEQDETDSIVRIMCPWTNFAIQDYVSQLSRLFDNDVEVRLLFRLPTWREWTQLKQNLLSRLGDTGGNLELRSYTRYKEYHDHSELRELRDDDDTYLQKTGVHAKLFIAGSPQSGNLLVGSANLMENSLYYNPEAGLQTRNPNVLETAINYFDLVWELSAPDRIPEEAYTGETEYTFFPAVYRP